MKLVLHGYLTPSLNRLLGKHWTVLDKEKKKAANALSSALLASQAGRSMPTISQVAASRSSTSSDTPI